MLIEFLHLGDRPGLNIMSATKNRPFALLGTKAHLQARLNIQEEILASRLLPTHTSSVVEIPTQIGRNFQVAKKKTAFPPPQGKKTRNGQRFCLASDWDSSLLISGVKTWGIKHKRNWAAHQCITVPIFESSRERLSWLPSLMDRSMVNPDPYRPDVFCNILWSQYEYKGFQVGCTPVIYGLYTLMIGTCRNNVTGTAVEASIVSTIDLIPTTDYPGMMIHVWYFGRHRPTPEFIRKLLQTHSPKLIN